MDVNGFSEWLALQSVPRRIGALAVIYSRLTVFSRELFLPDRTAGKEKRILEILHGLNEVHHTLANSLEAYSMDPNRALPVSVLGQKLSEIEKQYRLEAYVTAAVEFARAAMLPAQLDRQ